MDEHHDKTDSSRAKETTTGDTKLAPIITSSSLNRFSKTELLWNEFIKNLTKKPQTSTGICKYPNPEVPEFYPRSMKFVCKVSHETGDSSANEPYPTSCSTVSTLQQNLDFLGRNEIFLARMSQQCLGVQPTFVQAPETIRGITHYCWSYDSDLQTWDGPLERQGHTIRFLDTDKRINLALSTCQEPEPLGENETPTSTLQELNTKNQQLVHMNNVVKALLEEIYKINDLLMRNRIREQGVIDVQAFIEQYLQTFTELAYPCDDCCARLDEFVAHLSKQMERRMVKLHGQYRSNFVNYILSVIESSLRTLTNCSHIDDECAKRKSCKQDAYTQTDDASTYFYYYDEPFADEYVPFNRRSKQQTTRVYRNRNYYKYDMGNEAANSTWTGTMPRNNRVRRKNTESSFPQRRGTSALKIPSSWSVLENSKNPVQLIHQRFKNLNCRLEGIPEKKLVKFSYIVNNKEYSAIATTKKEAQYLCAWHMLNSCKD